METTGDGEEGKRGREVRVDEEYGSQCMFRKPERASTTFLQPTWLPPRVFGMPWV